MAFLIDILLHTGFFVITIPILYFELVAKLVNYALAKQVSDIAITEIKKTELTIIPKRAIQEIFNYLNNKFKDTIEKEQQDISKDNPYVYSLAYSVCGGISAGCIFIAFILSLIYGENFLELIYGNLIVLIFVIISEFVIVFFFLDQMKIIDFNFIFYTIQYNIYNPIGSRPNYWETTYNCNYVKDFLSSFLPEFILQQIYKS
jgi:hypothetical protein